MRNMSFDDFVKIAKRILFFASINFFILLAMTFLDLQTIETLALFLVKGLLFVANHLWLKKEQRENRHYSLFELCTYNCVTSVSCVSFDPPSL